MKFSPTTSMPCLIDAAGSCPLIAAGTQMRTLSPFAESPLKNLVPLLRPDCLCIDLKGNLRRGPFAPPTATARFRINPKSLFISRIGELRAVVPLHRSLQFARGALERSLQSGPNTSSKRLRSRPAFSPSATASAIACIPIPS